MKLKVVLVAAVVVLFTACASKDKKSSKPASLVDFERSATLDKTWSVSAGSGQDARYSQLVPALSENALYVSDVEGRVFSYDRTSHKRNWKVDTNKAISASLAIAGKQLYFGTFDGQLVALSTESGAVLWEAETSSEILSVPVSDSKVVVAQSIDGRVYGFSAEDGSQLWRYDHVVPSLTLRGAANPVISRNKVIVAFANGQLVTLNVADGALLWNARVSQPKGRTELEKMVDIDGTPVVDGSLIYAATYHGAIAVLSQGKGKVLWKQDLSTYNNVIVGTDRVFGVTEESHVVAFNSANGSIEWTNDQLHKRNIGSPILIGAYLAVIDDDGYLHLLSQKDGSFAYRFKPKGNGFRSPMIPYENGFIVLSNNGKLTAYHLAE